MAIKNSEYFFIRFYLLSGNASQQVLNNNTLTTSHYHPTASVFGCFCEIMFSVTYWPYNKIKLSLNVN